MRTRHRRSVFAAFVCATATAGLVRWAPTAPTPGEVSAGTVSRGVGYAPRGTVPGDSQLSIGGRVAFGGCAGGPVPNARIVFDDGTSTTTDGEGRYLIHSVRDAAVPGLPPGQHVIVASAPNARTKILRVMPHSRTVDIRMQPVSDPACPGNWQQRSLDAADATLWEVQDADADGVDDVIEDWLAERFAPIVHHGLNETSYPVSVDWFLKRTSLNEFADAATARREREVVRAPGSQTALVNWKFTGPDGEAVDSAGTRSVCKQSGYFLSDVREGDRPGQHDEPGGWTTYVHSYGNSSGGLTIQYWRVYAYDRSKLLFFDVGHGGDWEGISVHLDATLRPATVSFLGHRGIDRRPSREVEWEGSHPKVWSEEGRHASLARPSGAASSMFTRQETWNGGSVTWWDGRRNAGGGLVNVGEKSRPRNQQHFIEYSGLWGAPHRWFWTSGYWGPAFNETGAQCEDGNGAYGLGLGCAARCSRVFHTAWCDGIDGALQDRNSECFARRQSP